MIEWADRESLLSGLYTVVQEGRKNINGSKADIAGKSCQALKEKHFGISSVCASWREPRHVPR